MGGSLRDLAASAAAPAADQFISWAVVSQVVYSTAAPGASATVSFALYGAAQLDLSSATNLKTARVGTLNPGDKILVARLGAGAWVILDQAVPAAEGGT